MSSNNETVEPPTKEVEDLKLENGDTAPSQTQTTTTESSKSPIPPDSPQRQPSTGSFEEHFKAFAKFGDPKSDGKQITLSNSDKWMKQAKVIDGKKITTTDTGIYFKKFKSQKLGIVDYKKFLEDLAKNKKVELEEIKNKMAGCGPPGHHGIGAVKSAGAVDRLTDTSKYTGTHKQRFDGTGKGKGIVGRKDIADTSGYVTGYQNKDSFGKAEEK